MPEHDTLILLRLANTAFDADGRWQRSGMAAILLLQSASEQLLSPRGDEVETEDLSKGIAQFRNAVGGVLDILFARADGVELAWHWLENLLRQTPRVPPAGRSGPRKQMINRIGILAHALSSRMTPSRAQDAWIRETKPLERQFRAVAVLSVAAFTTTVADLDVGSIAKGLLTHLIHRISRCRTDCEIATSSGALRRRLADPRFSPNLQGARG